MRQIFEECDYSRKRAASVPAPVSEASFYGEPERLVGVHWLGWCWLGEALVVHVSVKFEGEAVRQEY